jgi:hypothetical protein
MLTFRGESSRRQFKVFEVVRLKGNKAGFQLENQQFKRLTLYAIQTNPKPTTQIHSNNRTFDAANSTKLNQTTWSSFLLSESLHHPLD